jgi:protein subunit release factor A
MTNCIVELRAAEGGADAKMLIEDMYVIYGKFAERSCL